MSYSLANSLIYLSVMAVYFVTQHSNLTQYGLFVAQLVVHAGAYFGYRAAREQLLTLGDM